MDIPSNIRLILDREISREGGLVDNPSDLGGITNMGITIPTLSWYLGRQVTAIDIRTLTKEQAEEIYFRNFFLGPRFDTLPAGLDEIATDTAILHGPKWCIQQMQYIVNQCNFGPIDQDGVLGPQSQAAITKAYNSMQGAFINALVEQRINYYNQRVQDNPSQAVFLQGWINRAKQFEVVTPINGGFIPFAGA